MIKQSCMFTRGLSDNVLGWSEHRELLEEIAELFNFFFFFCLNIESLCSLSHCDVKSPVGNVFLEQLGLATGCSFPLISHSSQLCISHLHLFYFWNTSQKYGMDPCFCQNSEDSFHARD